jgi:polar amino acid transport system ATP-binding protein
MSAPASGGKVVLQIDQLQLRRGARTVLAGVSCTVERSELVAIMGPSGSGKTTILRAVAGLEPFHSGRIIVDGVALSGGAAIPRETLRQLRRKVGMVFQFHCLFEHLSALQNICLAPVHAHGVKPDAARRRARELLHSFGVEHRADALPRELSGGEAQRVAIARALAVDPPLLLMDEPTASLDPVRRRDLGETLCALTSSGRALLITSHDDDFVREFATKVIVLSGGEVVEEGPPIRVISHPQHPATERLLTTERARRRPAV